MERVKMGLKNSKFWCRGLLLLLVLAVFLPSMFMALMLLPGVMAVTFAPTLNISSHSIAILNGDSVITTLGWLSENPDVWGISSFDYATNQTLYTGKPQISGDYAFSVNNERMAAAAINDTHYVVVYYSNNTAKDLVFMRGNINTGIEVQDVVLYDSTGIINNPRILVLNQTHFITAFLDGATDDLLVYCADFEGAVSYTAQIDANIADSYGVLSMSKYNETHTIIYYYDGAAKALQLALFFSHNGSVAIPPKIINYVGTVGGININDDMIVLDNGNILTTHTATNTTYIFNETEIAEPNNFSNVRSATFPYSSRSITITRLYKTENNNFILGLIDASIKYTLFKFDYTTLVNTTGAVELVDLATEYAHFFFLPQREDYYNASFCDSSAFGVYLSSYSPIMLFLFNSDLSSWDGECIPEIPPSDFGFMPLPDKILQNTSILLNWSVSNGTDINYNITLLDINSTQIDDYTPIDTIQILFNATYELGNYTFKGFSYDTTARVSNSTYSENFTICAINYSCVVYADCIVTDLQYCTTAQDIGCDTAYTGNLSEFTRVCIYTPPTTDLTTLDLSQQGNIILFGLFIFFWLGLGALAFTFKNVLYGSMMFFVGIVLGFWSFSISWILTAMFILFSALFMMRTAKFK